MSKALTSFLKYTKNYLFNMYRINILKDTVFPPEVWIENTNCCNAHCIMCPREKHTRKLGFMDFKLFEKLVKEIAAHRDTVRRIHLHNYGEPLLDKELYNRIRLAKEYGIAHLYFVTNASLLSNEKSKELIESGLNEFKISFYGTDTETYNKTMVGLDFETTINNVKNFLRLRKELKSMTPNIIIQYLPQQTNKAKIKDFFNLFNRLIDKKLGDSFNIFSLHNYGGGRNYNVVTNWISKTCDYPWRTMVILHDGKVVPCCLDYNGVQVIGDVNVSTISEIWNGHLYKQLRNDFKRLQYQHYPVCLLCERVY